MHDSLVNACNSWFLLAEKTFRAACEDGDYEVAKSLLEKGVRVDLQDNHGWSALMCASQEGHVQVARLLLEHGAKVDLLDGKGWSALMSACRMGHCEVAKLLLEGGADVDLQSVKWESAFSLALLHNNPKMINLIEKKVNSIPI